MEIRRHKPVIPFGWFYAFITWSKLWGLKYYENGRLVKTQENYDWKESSNKYFYVVVGKSPKYGWVYKPFTLQMSDLVFWYGFPSEAAVKEKLSLSGMLLVLLMNHLYHLHCC